LFIKMFLIMSLFRNPKALALSCIFLTSMAWAGEVNSSGDDQLNKQIVYIEIDEKDKLNKCVGPVVSIFGINQDSDDAAQKYSVGKLIEVKPGKTEIWYACTLPIPNDKNICLYDAPLNYSTAIFDLVKGKTYKLSCNSEEALRLEVSNSDTHVK
jgi:hypothetical protein